MAEPDKFYVGVVDLFSIILPGAVLTYVVRLQPEVVAWLGPDALGPARELSDVEGWAVFLVASYVLGHFIFLFGALLDKPVYDRLRAATAWNQTRRAAANERQPPEKRKSLAWPPTRWLAARLFGSDADLAIKRVLELKGQRIPDEGGKPVVNAFQWAKARLAVLSPAGLAEVSRYEADSKFFRSFSVVLLLLLLATIPQAGLGGAGSMLPVACAALLVLSLWRYIERRFKSTQLAYWHVITLETSPAAPAPAADD